MHGFCVCLEPSTGKVQRCQNSDLDLEVENEINVRRSLNFVGFISNISQRTNKMFFLLRHQPPNGFEVGKLVNLLWPFDLEIWQNDKNKIN